MSEERCHIFTEENKYLGHIPSIEYRSVRRSVLKDWQFWWQQILSVGNIAVLAVGMYFVLVPVLYFWAITLLLTFFPKELSPIALHLALFNGPVDFSVHLAAMMCLVFIMRHQALKILTRPFKTRIARKLKAQYPHLFTIQGCLSVSEF